jgi:7-carboxy-7-deazaguanine synthase
MRLSEMFYSVQGEGMLAGVPSVFIRTTGCNLRCSWCDTPYTSWQPEGSEYALDQILGFVGQHPTRHVVITGGEPMLVSAIVELTGRLRALGQHITIETAGTVDQPVQCDLMSISPKLANSTPAEEPWRTRHEQLRLQPDVLRSLMARYPYQLKFVMAAEPDIAEVRDLVAKLDADPARVLLMPEGVDRDILRDRGIWLSSLAMREGFRLSPRLHVELFGNRRGV